VTGESSRESPSIASSGSGPFLLGFGSAAGVSTTCSLSRTERFFNTLVLGLLKTPVVYVPRAKEDAEGERNPSADFASSRTNAAIKIEGLIF